MSVIRFPPFVLDLSAGLLLRGAEVVHLRPRTWDVLCYLAGRPGRLVTKDDLMDAVWSDAVVSEGTLTNSIRELRAALGDDARSPRFVETVHRRGFRFVAVPAEAATRVEATVPVNAAPRVEAAVPVGAGERAAGRDARGGEAIAAGLASGRETVARFVGRTDEIRILVEAAAQAAAGATRVVLVRGEAGIGKSSVVERFLAAVAARSDLRGMRAVVGRAVGYLQGAPPYLPVLSAIEQLATGDAGGTVLEALRHHAPDLLQQMPWLTSESRPGATEPKRRDLASRLADLLSDLTGRFPIALVLEDLHDADAPTVELVLSLLEERRARGLLVVATYRTGEAVLATNGLTAAADRIAATNGGSAIDLELLGQSEVAAYLAARDPSFWTEQRTSSVHRQSGGNPLFMVTVADTVELVGSAMPHAAAVPESLRELLETQLRSLEFAEREMLMAASAVGVEFSSLAVAAATGRMVDEIEDACEELARHARFVKTTGVADWPSGAVGQAYAFRHDLYRQALYATIPAARRQALHQRIGEALEKGFAGETMEVAAMLADQFGLSGDAARAIVYLRQAAELARERSAHRESLDLLDRAFALLERLTGAGDRESEREQAEFAIQVERAVSAGQLYGYGSALSREACERVAALGARLPASYERFFSLLVVFGYQIIRSDVPAASALAEQMMRMSESLDVPVLSWGARAVTAMAATARGDLVAADEGFRTFVYEVPRELRFPNFRDVICPSLTVMAQNLCYLDRRADAERAAAEAVERADWLADEYERADTRVASAYCAALYGDRPETLRWAREVERIAREHDIDEPLAVAEIFIAWADETKGIDERRASAIGGIRGLERVGRLLGKAFFLDLLVDLEIEAGDFEAALATLAAAREFCESTGAYRHLSELCRRTAWIEEKLGRRDAAARSRDWLAEARRVGEQQGCALTLARLEEDSSGRASATGVRPLRLTPDPGRG